MTRLRARWERLHDLHELCPRLRREDVVRVEVCPAARHQHAESVADVGKHLRLVQVHEHDRRIHRVEVAVLEHRQVARGQFVQVYVGHCLGALCRVLDHVPCDVGPVPLAAVRRKLAPDARDPAPDLQHAVARLYLQHSAQILRRQRAVAPDIFLFGEKPHEVRGVIARRAQLVPDLLVVFQHTIPPQPISGPRRRIIGISPARCQVTPRHY